MALLGPYNGNKIKSIRVLCELHSTSCSNIEKCSDGIDDFVLKTSRTKTLFSKEVAVARVLPPHPNLLCLLDAHLDVSKKQFMLLYDYCPGGDLFDAVAEKYVRKSVDQILRDVVLGLQHLHRHGIVHRDLKLENLLIDRDGHVKICDFAFCEYFNPPKEGFDAISFFLRRDNSMRISGTMGHIAPDILFNKKEATPETDIFSLGVVFYEICTETAAYHETDRDSFFVDVNTLEFPDGFPTENEALIRRMLSPNPTERPSLLEILMHPITGPITRIVGDPLDPPNPLMSTIA